MKGREQYTPKTFCRLTGLKPDTLRFYVDQKLLTPDINPVNRYKQYDPVDVVDMFYIRGQR